MIQVLVFLSFLSNIYRHHKGETMEAEKSICKREREIASNTITDKVL